MCSYWRRGRGLFPRLPWTEYIITTTTTTTTMTPPTTLHHDTYTSHTTIATIQIRSPVHYHFHHHSSHNHTNNTTTIIPPQPSHTTTSRRLNYTHTCHSTSFPQPRLNTIQAHHQYSNYRTTVIPLFHNLATITLILLLVNAIHILKDTLV